MEIYHHRSGYWAKDRNLESGGYTKRYDVNYPQQTATIYELFENTLEGRLITVPISNEFLDAAVVKYFTKFQKMDPAMLKAYNFDAKTILADLGSNRRQVKITLKTPKRHYETSIPISFVALTDEYYLAAAERVLEGAPTQALDNLILGMSADTNLNAKVWTDKSPQEQDKINLNLPGKFTKPAELLSWIHRDVLVASDLGLYITDYDVAFPIELQEFLHIIYRCRLFDG